MAESNWSYECRAVKKAPRGPLSAPWIRPKTVATPFEGSIFSDKRMLPRPAPAPVAPPVGRSRPSTTSTYRADEWLGTLAHPTPSFLPTGVFANKVNGSLQVGPDRLDVHHQWHVGGNSGLVAAGVRCQTSTQSSAPWTVQTGKPPGGWSVAGSMAVGW